jgi:predicted 3-demethylubiquinone-9 3-methyltransferase (glyoxalase superfamily)
MQKIRSCLWFDTQAEEAAKLYVSLFPDSGIDTISRYGKEGHEFHGRPAGSVMTVEFHLRDTPFMGLNGGPTFKFSEAVSFVIDCETQDEVDHYWNGLIANGGAPSMCGWLRDPFGLSWQVTPTILDKYMRDKDPVKAGRVMNAMLKMRKIDIAEIERAYKG